jgi:hypothetical protein
MTAALELARSRKNLRFSLDQLSKRTGLSRQWLDAIGRPISIACPTWSTCAVRMSSPRE